ncbi:hypothetical protein NQZ68_029278 [Dissostichus eleginoides]|nr:hypothetical protein NQZ68_029278 [Dissostichus eleginoides]
MKVKYKNIIQSAKRKTGGGPPPPDFTPAEELALSNNADDGDNVVLLPPPNHPLLLTEEGLADETLSVCSESALAIEGVDTEKELFLPRSLGSRHLGPHHDK